MWHESLQEWTIRILLATSFVSTCDAHERTLCKADETITVSCSLDRGKYVSICRSESRDDLTYRFGRPGAIELEHTDAISQTSSFFYGNLEGAETTAFELGFSKSNHKYTVYRYIDNQSGSTRQGLHVDIPHNKAGIDLRCKGEVVDRDFSKMIDVSCDDDMVIGCTYPELKGQWLIPKH